MVSWELEGNDIELKGRICTQMFSIAAGNRHTMLPPLIFHIESIENRFSHYRISDDTIMALKIGELCNSIGHYLEILGLPPCLTISCLMIFLPPSS